MELEDESDPSVEAAEAAADAELPAAADPVAVAELRMLPAAEPRLPVSDR